MPCFRPNISFLCLHIVFRIARECVYGGEGGLAGAILDAIIS